ncbi:MAG: nicotinate phosphoribosyltransferase [Coriobacteriia bacterium]|nr:nicotinate phosphoribosyltransferase [Coriobacteriia bacterium]
MKAEDAGSRALLTDLYQLTMAYGYHKAGIADTEACFHLSFRNDPFEGGFSIACGLAPVIEYLDGLRFTDEDCAYLARQKGNDGTPLFGDEFIGWLRDLHFELDITAIPEGTVVFPGEPLLRVIGPIAQCQLVETPLLNIVNFSTLIATKAARVCLAAEGDPVVEFGLRRAQGPDGGLSASRAAYIGGCAGTSNTLAAMRFGIPAVGTHAHSWVMAFDSEPEAFSAYVAALPNNVTLLVDTYDTLEGVRNAVAAGRLLRERGQRLAGIRIDSGDLAWLSKRAREILDDGGFRDTKIIASNELDEYLIESLKEQGAPIDLWGVGTRLVTAEGQPALGGVYKLSAIRKPGGDWQPRIKVSEQTAKITTPGLQAVRRFSRDGVFVGDMIYSELDQPCGAECLMVDPGDSTRRKGFSAEDDPEELLVPVFQSGRLVYTPPSLPASRLRACEQLSCLDASHKRFLNPHRYAVGIERRLHELRTDLIMEARGIRD